MKEPPVRASIHDPARLTKRIRVSVDGTDVTNDCREYDTVGGWVVLLERDAKGRSFLDPNTHNLAMRKVFGAVTVKWN